MGRLIQRRGTAHAGTRYHLHQVSFEQDIPTQVFASTRAAILPDTQFRPLLMRSTGPVSRSMQLYALAADVSKEAFGVPS